MDIQRLRECWPTSMGPALAAMVLLVPDLAAAQGKSPAAVLVADSAHAVATACAVVQGLRPAAERYRCRMEHYMETPTEYVVRVREEAPPGAAPLVFGQSEVRLQKTEHSVIVTRIPEL
jgi:hypothetical protein